MDKVVHGLVDFYFYGRQYTVYCTYTKATSVLVIGKNSPIEFSVRSTSRRPFYRLVNTQTKKGPTPFQRAAAKEFLWRYQCLAPEIRWG